MIHADDVRPDVATVTQQFLEQNAMKRAPHPVYSPDLASSDFYLFGDVNGGLHRPNLSSRKKGMERDRIKGEGVLARGLE
jgi:hypothetical protein